MTSPSGGQNCPWRVFRGSRLATCAWSRGREVARGVLRSSLKPEKRPIFCHRRGIENFFRLFSTQQRRIQRRNVFVSNAWPAPATYHRSLCEHCDQRMGRSPSRARPVQISWRSRWFCQSISVQDSESCRFEQTFGLSFSQGDHGPRSAQEFFFPGFLESLKLFFRRFALIANGAEIFWRVSLKF